MEVEEEEEVVEEEEENDDDDDDDDDDDEEEEEQDEESIAKWTYCYGIFDYSGPASKPPPTKRSIQRSCSSSRCRLRASCRCRGSRTGSKDRFGSFPISLPQCAAWLFPERCAYLIFWRCAALIF